MNIRKHTPHDIGRNIISDIFPVCATKFGGPFVGLPQEEVSLPVIPTVNHQVNKLNVLPTRPQAVTPSRTPDRGP